MLKVGILLDGLRIQAWQLETIEQLQRTEFAGVEALIINNSPKESGSKSPILYRIYRWLDRKLFTSSVDAFTRVDVFNSMSKPVEQLYVNPIHRKYSDQLSAEDIESIRNLELDIILRLGFRILKGEILNLPRLGVWSFHHGDPEYYRGGPPAFWEVFNSEPVTGAVLMRINEDLDKGEVLYSTFTQTDPLSVQRNANKLFWSSSTFPARVIKEVVRLGEAEWLEKIIKSNQNYSKKIWIPPRSISLIKGLSNLIFKNFTRKFREIFYKPNWNIGVLNSNSFNSGLIKTEDILKVFPGQRGRYMADPFVCAQNYLGYVFFEDYDKKSGKGRISIIDPQGKTTSIIEETWHLSYPFVFEDDQTIYLIPESAEAGKIYLYESIDFPYRWERIGCFFEGELYDPTIHKVEDGYWLFGNQKAHPESSSFDELNLYFSKTLVQPIWEAYPLNPIVSDVRKARPAGKLFFEKGKLYRPAQDSGLRYGHRIKIFEVQELNSKNYREEEKTIIEFESGQEYNGIHTISQFGGDWLIDMYQRR